MEKFRKLAGKTVLIIGGSSGIGYAVAEGCLASSCSRVIISSSNTDNVDSAGRSLRAAFPIELCPSSIEGMVCDLSSPATTEANLTSMITAVARTGLIDHIIYTAGDAHRPRPLATYDAEFIQSVGHVRFVAPMILAKIIAANPLLMSSGPVSSIIITNGSVAESPSAGWTAETAYAAGIAGMTRAMALDLKPVRVNCVSIGVVDTPLLGKSFGSYRDRIIGAQKVNTYTGECAMPEDVAETYLGLMKDKSTTGSVVFADGGARYVPHGQLVERPKRSTSLKNRSNSVRGRERSQSTSRPNGGGLHIKASDEPVPALPRGSNAL